MEFEKVYCTYFNDVFRYIRRLSGNEHIAEEITADTFFKAMHSINNFRGDCDIRVWLCQIAKNSYLSYLKKSGRIDNIEDGLDQPSKFSYGKAIHLVCAENRLCFEPIVLSQIQHKRLRLSGWSLFLCKFRLFR